MTTENRSKDYYDEFSKSYEQCRHDGYHALIDDLEVDLAQSYCGGRLLEAGCGTGLILTRLVPNFSQVIGIDLSAGMLNLAQQRGLTVVQGSIDTLPFSDEYFDTVISFKVLAHVPEIGATIRELTRVTRSGGFLLLEFYNRHSLRGLIKRLKPASRTSDAYHDSDVFTRYDSLAEIRRLLPSNLRLIRIRGVRVFTPFAQVHTQPLVGDLFRRAERFAADTPLLRRFGGFLIVILQKQ